MAVRRSSGKHKTKTRTSTPLPVDADGDVIVPVKDYEIETRGSSCKEEAMKRREKRRHWTRARALDFIVELLPHVRQVGWEIGMTGSVLYLGESVNDLDLIFYPRSSGWLDAVYDDLIEALMSRGGKRIRNAREVHASWRVKGSGDNKHVEVWTFRGRRVDVFILS